MDETFSDILNSKEASLSSPDGNIIVTLRGLNIVDAYFRTGTYSRYVEHELEVQLIALIKLVIVAHNRSRREAIQEALGNDPSMLPDRKLTDKEIEFRKQVEKIEGEGHSDRISVYSRPMGFWDVEIEEGSLEETTGSEFLAEFLSVVSTARADTRRQVTAANNLIFGHISQIKINGPSS